MISPLEKSTLLRCFFPKVCWAAVLNSWSVDEGRNVRSSECPFGKTAFMWIMWDILSWRLVKTSVMHLYLTLWARAKRCRTWKISWLVGWWLLFIKRFLYTSLRLGPSSKEKRNTNNSSGFSFSPWSSLLSFKAAEVIAATSCVVTWRWKDGNSQPYDKGLSDQRHF